MEEALVAYLLAIPAANSAEALLHSSVYGTERGVALDFTTNAYASANATVMTLPAIVGSRIHWVRSPQGSASPRVVLYKISGLRDMTLNSGPTGYVSSRVQCDCFGTSYGSAKAVARALEARLSGYSGTTGNVRFEGAFLVGERDDFFDTDTPDKLFRTSLDFNIWTKGT